MAKQGEVIEGAVGKTKYEYIWTDVVGAKTPLKITASEWKTIIARGQKAGVDMPLLEEFAANASVSIDFINYTGYQDARSLGMKADFDAGVGEDKWTDNWKILQNYIDSLPLNTIARVYIPEGNYFFSKAITVKKGQGVDIRGPRIMPYHWQPTATANLKFGLWHQPCNGFEISGDALCSTLSDMHITGNNYEGGPNHSGIYHENIMNIERVWAEGFSYGFYTFAGVEAGGNSSVSYYQSCRASSNLVDGFYAAGPDANVITYLNCVGVQNWAAGFRDNSFLGCNYIGCHSATNGSHGSESIAAYTGGGFMVMQPTAHTNIAFSYSEGGDQFPNYINPTNFVALVTGGIHANGWTGALPNEQARDAGGDIVDGPYHTRLITKSLTADGMQVGNISVIQTQGYNEPTRISFQQGDVKFMELTAAGVPQASLGTFPDNQPQAKVSFNKASVTLPEIRVMGSTTELDGSPDMPSVAFQYGWKVINAPFDADKPEYWRCIKPGRNGASQKDFGIASMSNFGGDDSLQFATLSDPGRYSELFVGDHINLSNGATGRIHSVNTIYSLEVMNPAGITVHPGDRIDWFGNLDAFNQPVGYKNNRMLISYTPSTRVYVAGEAETMDGLPTTVLSVKINKGVQLVEFDFPKGADTTWFREGGNVGIGSPEVIRRPFSINQTDPKRPTVTIAFPMAGIESGAIVQVDGKECVVTAVNNPGITIKGIDGRVWPNQSGSTFTIATPEFKAY